MYVCMFYVCMYVCMYICMYVTIFARMYVCLYTCIHIEILLNICVISAEKGSGNCETVPVAPGTGITVDSLKTSNSFAYTKMACPSGKLPMEPVPKYFTCGPVGYWTRKNAKDAQPYISKPFRLPNCGSTIGLFPFLLWFLTMPF